MFVDFDKVFNNLPQNELKVPDALVKYFSSKLPKGMKYVADDNGNCTICSENGSYTVGGIILNPTADQQKHLGDKFSINDILAYSYNSQEQIPATLKKQGYITLNGEEMEIEKVSFHPFHPIEFIKGSFNIVPSPFPKPFFVTIGSEKYKRDILVSRVPNKSVNVARFKSSDEEPLKIEYSLNESKMDMKISLSYDLSNCKTIRDIVETTTIFNSYVDGKGQLFGRSLGDDVDFSNVSKYDEDSLLFWEKLLKLEEALNIQFTPQKKDIEFDTICLVEEIYQNLINNLPIRSDARIESVDGDWNMVDDNKIINAIGENAFFEFEATTHIELFGCSFDLPCLVAIINAKVSNFEKKGSKYTLYLDDESSEKRMFLSKLRFITEEDLKKFRDSDHDKIITMLHEAQRASEYI